MEPGIACGRPTSGSPVLAALDADGLSLGAKQSATSSSVPLDHRDAFSRIAWPTWCSGRALAATCPTAGRTGPQRLVNVPIPPERLADSAEVWRPCQAEAELGTTAGSCCARAGPSAGAGHGRGTVEARPTRWWPARAVVELPGQIERSAQVAWALCANHRVTGESTPSRSSSVRCTAGIPRLRLAGSHGVEGPTVRMASGARAPRYELGSQARELTEDALSARGAIGTPVGHPRARPPRTPIRTSTARRLA